MTGAHSGVGDGELAIQPSRAHRQRAAISAGGVVAAVLLPIGLVVLVIVHSGSVLLLAAFTALVATVASFVGQGRNQVFVGPRGVRRVSSDCDLVASWGSLCQLTVQVPGNRFVSFTLDTTGVAVERLSTRHSNAAEALARHPPEGFHLRLDREAADALIAEVARRRPELSGLAEWERASHPS